MKWRIRWPVYRVYGDEYGEFLGIWFHWPGIERVPRFTDTIGLRVEIDSFIPVLTGEQLAALLGESPAISWPDVTPREAIKHEWVEEGPRKTRDEDGPYNSEGIPM